MAEPSCQNAPSAAAPPIRPQAELIPEHGRKPRAVADATCKELGRRQARPALNLRTQRSQWEKCGVSRASLLLAVQAAPRHPLPVSPASSSLPAPSSGAGHTTITPGYERNASRGKGSLSPIPRHCYLHSDSNGRFTNQSYIEILIS